MAVGLTEVVSVGPGVVSDHRNVVVVEEVELFVSVKLHMFGGLEVVFGVMFDGGCQGKSQVGAAAGNGGC